MVEIELDLDHSCVGHSKAIIKKLRKKEEKD